jgi:excisionase family DNA binding protein
VRRSVSATTTEPRRIPRLLSVRAIAEATTLPASTVYDAIYSGELPRVTIGERGVRVDEADVVRWIDSRREGSGR